MLYSSRDERAYIIDVQAFAQRPGISPTQTKGFNTPLYLTRGLLPWAYCYAQKHSKDKELIKMRTEIVAKSIASAKRNNLNDVNGYLKGNMSDMQHFWELQLRKLNIPEKYRGMFLTEIGLIEQEQRYKPISKPLQYFHIQAFHDY